MAYGSSRNPLNNLKLKTKLGASFGLLVVMLTLVASVSFLGIAHIRELFIDYRDTAQENLVLTEMMEDMLEARLAVMELRAGKSVDATAKVNDNIQDLTEEAQRKIDSRFEKPEKRRALSAIVDDAMNYRERFEEAVAIHRELEGVQAAMASESETMESRLTDLVTTATDAGNAELTEVAFLLERKLASAKLKAERYIRRNRRTDLEAARTTFADASEAADRLSTLAAEAGYVDTATQVTEALDRYRAGFGQAEDLITRRNGIYFDQLDVIGPRIARELEAILDDSITHQREVGPESIASMEATQAQSVTVAAVAIAFSLAAALLLIRATSVPIRKLRNRLTALANGDTDFEVRKVNSDDEIGTMWTAVGELRHVAEAAFTRAQMIEQLPTPVLVADPEDDFKITYLNEGAKKTFRRLERHMPCGVDQMIGQTIDIFHQNPRRQREILRDPSRLPWTARVSFHDVEHLDLNVAALRDRQGRYVGAVLTLREVTEQVRGTKTFETEIKATVDQIGTTFGQMRDRIEAIANRVEDTQGQLAEGSHAVTEATSSVQMVASAAEELSSSITEIAGRLSESSKRATEASSSTSDVAERAQELATVSQRITEVVDTISDIADKTNLLALNATIEAASAGEAGKGFAVVAAEVKNLANQTAKATGEVSQQMSSIQSQITTVVGGITSVAHVIEDINAVFANVAAAAEEQQAATREITMNAHHAAGGAETAATTISRVRDFSSSSLEATRDLSAAAKELAEANDNLARQSEEFLSVMKKAG